VILIGVVGSDWPQAAFGQDRDRARIVRAQHRGQLTGLEPYLIALGLSYVRTRGHSGIEPSFVSCK
jgi:hypothetical protein